jgi:hypothetical protein
VGLVLRGTSDDSNMTKSSKERIARHERRRKDISTDPDLITIEFALALKAAWQMSERAAFDFVVARFESRMTDPTKTPRGEHPGSIPVGYETFPRKTVSGRSATLRQKSKRYSPRPDVVRALILALRCRDMDAAQRLFDGLSMLGALAGPDRVRRVIAELVAQMPLAD